MSRSALAIFFLLSFGFLFFGCKGLQDEDKSSTVVKGRITVDSTLDKTGDYSGIDITVIHQPSTQEATDTLFHAITDTTGHFKGKAIVPERRVYPLIIGRYGNTLTRSSLVLADGDTVTIKGELPNFGKSASIQSKENRALEEFQRVQRSYNRVAKYAQAGKITGDSLLSELDKWSDIFWSVYKDHPTTLAGKQAAAQSLSLLKQLDGSMMMDRIYKVDKDEILAGVVAEYGKEYLTSSKGLNFALSYLDTLKRKQRTQRGRMRVEQERLELLYDSARVEQAKKELKKYRNEFKSVESSEEWTKSLKYDLENLAPGDQIPAFQLTSLEGNKITDDSLRGQPYLLEFTNVNNQQYVSQFPRTQAINRIYRSYGLNIVTVPLDTSATTVQKFFEERPKPWFVVNPESVDRNNLVKRFNINRVPTRFLVDKNGNIVRKYVREEYQDIIKGLGKVLKKPKNTP